MIIIIAYPSANIDIIHYPSKSRVEGVYTVTKG